MRKEINIFNVLFLCVSQILLSQTIPAPKNYNYTTRTNTVLNVAAPGLLSNHSDTEELAFSITTFSINDITYNANNTAKLTEGTITIQNNGSFNFIPAKDYSGIIPVVIFTIFDGTNSETANLIIHIFNDFPPTAKKDYDTVETDTPLSVAAPGVLINDEDRDNNTISVSGFEFIGKTYLAGETGNSPEGSITLNADGSYVFVPAIGYTGDVPDINYVITDGMRRGSATLFLMVVPN